MMMRNPRSAGGRRVALLALVGAVGASSSSSSAVATAKSVTTTTTPSSLVAIIRGGDDRGGYGREDGSGAVVDFDDDDPRRRRRPPPPPLRRTPPSPPPPSSAGGRDDGRRNGRRVEDDDGRGGRGDRREHRGPRRDHTGVASDRPPGFARDYDYDYDRDRGRYRGYDDDNRGRRDRFPPNNDEDYGDRHDVDRGVGGGRMRVPPPPPPPPRDDGGATTIASSSSSPSSRVGIDPAGTGRIPIHYVFPTAEAAAEERRRGRTTSNDMTNDGSSSSFVAGENVADDFANAPFPDVDEDEFFESGGGGRRRKRRRTIDDDDDDNMRFGASPRRDAVTTFMSTRRGAMKVRVGSVVVGASMGGFIGKSLMNDPLVMSMAMSSLLFVVGFLRNDYGELSRALGLALVLTLQRTGSVRREYPTLPHLKAMIRQGPRRPFPPVEDGSSPWRYEPTYRDDPEFKMTYALLAMSIVGSFCGGNVPILPAWIGGILGVVTFASFTTGANARGDLGRAMGMRLVGLVREALAINSDLRILGKAATVGGLIFDKVMIMDRKHRIKDKIVAICKWGYDKVSRTAEQVKEEMQDERPLRR